MAVDNVRPTPPGQIGIKTPPRVPAVGRDRQADKDRRDKASDRRKRKDGDPKGDSSEHPGGVDERV